MFQASPFYSPNATTRRFYIAITGLDDWHGALITAAEYSLSGLGALMAISWPLSLLAGRAHVSFQLRMLLAILAFAGGALIYWFVPKNFAFLICSRSRDIICLLFYN